MTPLLLMEVTEQLLRVRPLCLRRAREWVVGAYGMLLQQR